MNVETHEEFTSLTIFEPRGEGFSISEQRWKIQDTMILFVAGTGHGKTLALIRTAQMFHNEGYLVIFLTEKPDKPLEVASMCFEPTAKYHLNLLKKHGSSPFKETIKIYSPVTFNKGILNKKLPDVLNFFSIPVDTLTKSDFALLLETEQTNTLATNLLSNVTSQLKEDQGIFYLLYQAEELIEKYEGKNKTPKRDFTRFGLKTSAAGDKKTISTIQSFFEPFLIDYIVKPKNYFNNLNFKELFQNQKDIHILTTSFLKDTKLKYFVVRWFFDNLIKNIEYCKYPILFIVQEGSVFLPDQSKDIFVKKTALFLQNKLSTIRNVGRGCSCLIDSQSLYGVSDSVREFCPEHFYGNLSVGDIERLSKTLGYNQSFKKKFFENVKRGQYIRKFDSEVYKFLLPTCSHTEKGEDFFYKFRKHYPDSMKDNKDVLEKEREQIKKERAFVLEISIQEKKSLQKKAKELEKAVKEKKKKKEPKKAKAEPSKEKLAKICYDLRQEGLSFSKIARKIGISDKTAKAYFESYKKEILTAQSGENPLNSEAI